VIEARAAREARSQRQHETLLARAEAGLMGLAEAEARLWAKLGRDRREADAFAKKAAEQRACLVEEHEAEASKVVSL